MFRQFIVEILLIYLFIILPIAFGIQCEKITVAACQGLGYNMTAMPNLADHTSQKDAEMVINQLLPILDSDCSQHARFLLCASMFPLCSPDVSRPVAACKSLCETVKFECSSDAVLDLLWPKFIDCNSMPQPEKQELCMQIPHEELKSRTTSMNRIWSWTSATSTGTSITNTISAKKTQLLKIMNPVICPINFTAIFDECGAQCGADAMFSEKQKYFIKLWTLSLSAICFVLTLFSLVTFWAEPLRFGYPERPVLYLALSYNLLSMFYLEQVIFHHPVEESELTEHGGVCSAASPCIASYVTTSYLTLCASTWWLIFSICWYLSTEKQWSSEALEKKSGIFHIVAWVPPLAPPIAALLWGGVRPDELTGMCSAPGYIEIPALIILASGAVFTILAARSLKGLSTTVRDYAYNKRLSQVRSRILVFSCVFFVPAFAAITIGFFIETRGRIASCILGDPCTLPDKYSMVPTVLRLFFILAGGSLTGMWVWSKKTCESYRNRITKPSPSLNVAANSITKYCANTITTPKKSKTIGPLYAGINFHNVPVNNITNSAVAV